MNIVKSIIDPKSTLKQALQQMSQAGKKCLIVVQNDKFLGTLSDGDIRKALLANTDMGSNIEKAFNKKAYYVYKNNFDKDQIKKVFLKEKYDLIPILNEDNSVSQIIGWDEVFAKKQKNKELDIPVVIMAGGKGTRLKPFTNVLPKTLIPINGRTVIELITESFTNSGVKEFFISINFKGKILKAFFEELEPSFSVNFLEEKKPLGTGGALHKLSNKIKSTFFVTNCDVIFDIDHSDLLKFHREHKCDLTLVASAKEIEIPYGACEINEDGYLKKISEKPKLDYLVNTGLYVLEPSSLDYIPKNRFFHITDLIEEMGKDKKKIGVFPIDDNAWVDIGQWEEYRNAVKGLN